MRFPIIACLVALLAVPVAAAPLCERLGAGTLFHCRIDGSSQEVTVCDLTDGDFLYVYGRPGRPELELRRGQAEVVYTPWNGVGSAFWARLGFFNDGYLYDVGYSAAKDGSEPIYGFVDIYEPGHGPETGSPVVTKECRPGTVETRLEGLWQRFD